MSSSPTPQAAEGLWAGPQAGTCWDPMCQGVPTLLLLLLMFLASGNWGLEKALAGVPQ